jgi:hypothetical protein
MDHKSRVLLEIILRVGIANRCINLTEVGVKCGIKSRTLQSAVRRGYLTDYQAKLFMNAFGCDTSIYPKLVRGSNE